MANRIETGAFNGEPTEYITVKAWLHRHDWIELNKGPVHKQSYDSLKIKSYNILMNNSQNTRNTVKTIRTSSAAIAERLRDARVTSIRKIAKWNFWAIRGVCVMRSINFLLTYLLT